VGANWSRCSHHRSRKARAFYEDVLGLRLVADEKPFALVFDAKKNGTMLRVTDCPRASSSSVYCGSAARLHIEETVYRLCRSRRGIQSLQGDEHADPRGIWNSPSGARIALVQRSDGMC